VVRGTIGKLAADLEKIGARVERNSPLLPDFAETSRLYMRMLMSFLAASFPPEAYAGAQAAVAALPASETSLRAERLRGMVQSHRNWLMDDVARGRLRAQRRPIRTTIRRSRKSAASGSTTRITSIPTSSPGPALLPCPACPRPRSRPASRRMDCRSACRSSVPGWKTARR
jgi:hypothetical protein